MHDKSPPSPPSPQPPSGEGIRVFSVALPKTKSRTPYHSSISARQGSSKVRGMSAMNRDGELTVIPNCLL
jgi:hypothetical protein